MADQMRTRSLRLLQETRGLVGEAMFNPLGCNALLACADHLSVSPVTHSRVEMLIAKLNSPKTRQLPNMQIQCQNCSITEWAMVENWMRHVAQVCRYFAGRYVQLTTGQTR